MIFTNWITILKIFHTKREYKFENIIVPEKCRLSLGNINAFKDYFEATMLKTLNKRKSFCNKHF